MTDPLKILVIEDSPVDYLLIQRALARHGLVCGCRLVSTAGELTRAMATSAWDVVLADYSLPTLATGEALSLVRTALPDVPVIVVSGTIGEERAVELLKAGAADFVLKGNLSRLGAAVERALNDVAGRRASRETEAELRRLNAAINAAADSIVITDRNGTITWVNPAFSAMSGYDAREAIGQNPRALVKSGLHDREYFRELWDTILAGHVWRGEITNRRKSGEQYPEQQSITPVRDDDGQITHFIAIKRDLTDQRRLQAQLAQAQRLESVGRLAAGVSHDFNNLITAIIGIADLATLRLAPDDALRPELDNIRETAERAATLTKQLLTFSGRQVVSPEVLRLHSVVVGMQDMLQRLLGEDIKLTVASNDHDDGLVRANRSQLEQIVMNLAVNARDAMPRGGALTIETALDGRDLPDGQAPPDPYVWLSVKDSGLGMDTATRERVFEPFFTTKEQGKGTGLGLATVYGVVTQMGGTIRVDSEPAHGTTFTIRLPRVTGEGASSTMAPRVVSNEAVGGTETILVVEDETVLRDLAARMLRSLGYSVLCAADGEEALSALAQAEAVNLVLTDVVMPGMSGRELSGRLSGAGNAPRVLYTSGYTEDIIIQYGVPEGEVWFLPKPYTLVDLAVKVREVLDAPGSPPAV